MFEKAVRTKLRFESPMGLISVEDLWDLPLKGGRANLDDIARNYHKKLKDSETESFVDEGTKDEAIQLRFDILLYIINVKKDEKKAAMDAAENKRKKDQILGLIAQKKNEALSNASLEDLEKMVAEM